MVNEELNDFEREEVEKDTLARGEEVIAEAVACDWRFPDEGVNKDTRLVLVLHGLNGGSKEMYIKDFAEQCTRGGRNYVVCALNARGYGGTPLRSDRLYCGARTSDIRKSIEMAATVWRAC